MVALTGTLAALLFSGNLYFLKRLVDKLDKTSNSHEETCAQVLTLSQNVNGLVLQVREIKLDVKELRKMEIDVAVLRTQLKPAKTHNCFSN
jgi:hypothetical protein